MGVDFNQLITRFSNMERDVIMQHMESVAKQARTEGWSAGVKQGWEMGRSKLVRAMQGLLVLLLATAIVFMAGMWVMYLGALAIQNQQQRDLMHMDEWDRCRVLVSKRLQQNLPAEAIPHGQ